MDQQMHNGAIIARMLASAAVCLALAACGSKVDCSSSDAISTVAKIAVEEAMKRNLDKLLPYVDLPTAKVGVVNIRTRSQDDRHASCAGEMDWHLRADREKLRNFLKERAGEASDSELDQAISDINRDLLATDKSLADPITYEVEKTDNGGLYVTVQGLFKKR